jgi:hypothetical protein
LPIKAKFDHRSSQFHQEFKELLMEVSLAILEAVSRGELIMR